MTDVGKTHSPLNRHRLARLRMISCNSMLGDVGTLDADASPKSGGVHIACPLSILGLRIKGLAMFALGH